MFRNTPPRTSHNSSFINFRRSLTSSSCLARASAVTATTGVFSLTFQNCFIKSGLFGIKVFTVSCCFILVAALMLASGIAAVTGKARTYLSLHYFSRRADSDSLWRIFSVTAVLLLFTVIAGLPDLDASLSVSSRGQMN